MIRRRVDLIRIWFTVRVRLRVVGFVLRISILIGVAVGRPGGGGSDSSGGDGRAGQAAAAGFGSLQGFGGSLVGCCCRGGVGSVDSMCCVGCVCCVCCVGSVVRVRGYACHHLRLGSGR